MISIATDSYKRKAFDLSGEHTDSIRQYNNGEWNEVSVESLLEQYDDTTFLRKLFAELVRYSESEYKLTGQYSEKFSDIPNALQFHPKKIPSLYIEFLVSDVQTNSNENVSNITLSTTGKVVYQERNILQITNKTNPQLYENFVKVVNSNVETEQLF